MAFRRFLRLSLCLALAVLVGGCDSSFEPYAETEQAFSLFGVIDMESQRHPVRVEPLQDGRPYTAGPEIDATATLVHVETGREIALQSQRSPRRGGFQHEFVALFEPQFSATYRLQVRRSDGNTSTATLTTPSQIPELSLSARGDQPILAVANRLGQDRLLFLTARYRVRLTGEVPSVERTFTVEYDENAAPTPSGYSVELDWQADLAEFRRNLGEGVPGTLVSVEATVGAVHPSAPEYGGLSYEELFEVAAGAPSNVENGYGYVAGTSRDTAFLMLEDNSDFPEVSF